MEPFDNYPPEWLQRPQPRAGANCRHEYGLVLHAKTGQSSCAYCGLPLTDTYWHWLLMAVDHVVPTRAGRKAGIPEEWLCSWANCVLCCSVCNGFRNRQALDATIPVPASWEEFLELRDRVFHARRVELQQFQPHEKEEAFFNERWRRSTKAE